MDDPVTAAVSLVGDVDQLGDVCDADDEICSLGVGRRAAIFSVAVLASPYHP